MKLHGFVIMPNRIHEIIEITTVGADSKSALSDIRAEMDSAPTPAIPEIVQLFKRYTTIKYIKTNPLKWNDDKYYA